MAAIAQLIDRRITFQRNTRPPGFGKAGQENWQDVATVWAQVRDTLPSRSEREGDGLTIATRTSRVRIRYRDDITADMRILYGARVMQIIAGPAEIQKWDGMLLNRREAIELMAADYSTAGEGA